MQVCNPNDVALELRFLRLAGCLQAPHQLPRIDLQRLGQLEDVVEADVPLASLHLAHERPMQAAVIRQLLLALAQLMPPGAHPFTEGLCGC